MEGLQKEVDYINQTIVGLQTRQLRWLTPGIQITTTEVQITWDELAEIKSELSSVKKTFFFRGEAETESSEILKGSIATATGALLSLQVKVGDALRRKEEAAKVANQSRTSTPFKLDKIKLPQFNGNFSEWQSFQDLFVAAVNDNPGYSDAEKIVYLRTALVGDAFTIVKQFPTSNASYADAWNLVKRRYTNHREIVFSHMRKFFDLKPCQDSSKGLFELCDTINECIMSLRNVNVPVDQWDLVFIFVAQNKMDTDSKEEWLLTQGKDLPNLKDFLEYLEKRAAALVDTSAKASKSKVSSNVTETSTSSSSSSKSCVKCNGSHPLYLCKEFKKLSVKERWECAKRTNRCYKCLCAMHKAASDCTFAGCRECTERHHPLLHISQRSNAQSNTPTPSNSSNSSRANQSASTPVPPATPSTSTAPPSNPPEVPITPIVMTAASHSSFAHQAQVVLMETALVCVRDNFGEFQQCRVFLDSGSEDHFVSEQCVDRLGLAREKQCVEVTGIGGKVAETSHGLATIKVYSLVNSYTAEFKASILKKVVRSLMPHQSVIPHMEHLQDLQLADPTFCTPGEVDILIGTRLLNRLSRNGLRHGPPGFPGARNTVFGWVLSGEAPAQSPHTSYSVQCLHSRCSPEERCVDSTLQRFWELEQPTTPLSLSTKEEEECEKWFQSSVKKVAGGSYSVGLPFIPSFVGLGSSRNLALRRLYSVEKSLTNNEEMKQSYHRQMKEYLDDGWMEEISGSQTSKPSSYYLPHHLVTKQESSTTKFRIVFDASAKSSNGLSLNNVLRTGPKLQMDLIPILLQFRTHVVALSADIAKFYNGFHIHSSDAEYQRLLYRESTDDPVRDMKMLRVTFGVAPAPFLAIRCLHQLADDNRDSLPLAHPVIKREFLVDNLLSGASTVEGALRLQNELIQLMGIGKLQLRKWTSNFPALVTSVPVENQAQGLPREVGADGCVKTIGLLWNPSVDTFSVKVTPPDTIASFATKRQVLSGIAKIFDPLGWLSPVIIRPKMLMQDLWKAKLDWDSHLIPELFSKWRKFCAELPMLKEFSVPRSVIFPDGSSRDFELHGFCDASNHAYAACIYLKVFSQQGHTMVNLLCAKTCVAPVKGETTPRLELCSADLLVKLLANVKSSISLPVSSFKCWSDSTCVLGWIASEETLPVFEHNRVRRIVSGLPMATWAHVKGEENPADCASRGISVGSFLSHPLWLHGPPWLLSTPRVMSATASVSTIVPQDDHFQKRLMEFISRSDSYLTMQRHLAWWIRFVRVQCNKRIPNQFGPLTVGELSTSLQFLIKCVQKETFQEGIKWCGRKRADRCTVKSMQPFLDNGILRVGGRVRSSFWSYDQKHPILLPRTHHFTVTVVRHLHEFHNHPGPQLLLTLLRDKFWVSNGLRVCASIVRKCIKCHRANPKPMSQIMGQLPKLRVTPAYPFHSVGIDYAGPFHLNATPGRNPRLIKGYVAVFVCLAVKAIHLEFVSDLSTPAFLAAFDRFVSTRGTPATIICDGGRNFLGAKNDVDEMQNFLASSSHLEKVTKFFVDQEVDFQFNPPLGPHHGGIFEAGVKSMKTHLHRVTDDRRLSIEEFWTLLKRIEATLNSRPLTPVSSDPNDFSVLTPGHFLIGRSLKAAPQQNLEDWKIHQMTRWQHVQQMAQHFNRRWSSQYLQSLQKSAKWFQEQPNLGIGKLVLMDDSDSSLGPQRWILGRISAVFPGTDNRVRTCDVTIPVTKKDGKVELKVYRRPIVRVSPLPVD